MSTKLNDDGERMIPEFHKGQNKFGAHLARYQASLSLVKGKTVLDIACGTGYGSKLMAGKAKMVYGIDISGDSIEYAMKNYSAKNVEFKVGDCLSVPLNDRSVNVVTSYETIEHISEPKKFMEEIRRILRPGGILLLSTPNKSESAGGNPYHLHEFTYDEIKLLVKKYFKYHRDYFQALWLYNSILPDNLQTREWEQPIKTTKTLISDQERCEFFFMICSDNKIPDDLEPMGVLSEHFRKHESPERAIAKTQKEVAVLKALIIKLEIQNNESKTAAAKLQKHLDAIQNSRAWRIARAMQRASSVVKK